MTTDSADSGSPLFKRIARARDLERRGRLQEARAEYKHALQGQASDPSVASAAALLRWIGGTLRGEGKMDAAQHYYEASLVVAESTGNVVDMAQAYNWLGIMDYDRGRMDAAVKHYHQAGRLAFRARDQRQLAQIRQNLGTAFYVQGDVARGIRNFNKSLECYRSIGDEEAAAQVLTNLGLVQTETELWDEAERSFSEAATICERTGDLQTRAMIEVNRVDLAVRRGDLIKALRICDHARLLVSQTEQQVALGEVYKWYGIIYRERGDVGLSQSHLEAALDLAQRCSNLLLEGEVHRELGLLWRSAERNRAALESLNRANQIFGELRAQRMVSDIDAQVQELQTIFLDVVERWGTSIEQKDRYTAGHCQRVADYSCMIAQAAGFDEQALTWFRMAAFLHDVGKTAIPAHILNKTGKLDDVEWETMRHHTVLGDELLSGIEFPWDVRPVVRSHHERWDGTGYPDALAGEEIPLGARILAIADAYDALTTTRSYRPASTHEEAIAKLRPDVGKNFDPHLFELFEQEMRKRAPHAKGAA